MNNTERWKIIFDQIVFGKRQSGKSTYVLNRMKQQNSIYVCYNQSSEGSFKEKNPDISDRIIKFSKFKKMLKNNEIPNVERIYIQWLNFNMLVYQNLFGNLYGKVKVTLIFDQYAQQTNFGIKFNQIERLEN